MISEEAFKKLAQHYSEEYRLKIKDQFFLEEIYRNLVMFEETQDRGEFEQAINKARDWLKEMRNNNTPSSEERQDYIEGMEQYYFETEEELEESLNQ